MKSRFITGLWIFGMVAGVLGLVSGAMQLASLWSLRAQPELVPLLQESLGRMGLNLTPEQLEQMVLRNGITILVVSILTIGISLALRRRARWSRKAVISLIAILTVGMLASLVRSEFAANPPLYWTGVTLTVIAAFIHGGIILKLRSPEIRAEFENKESVRT